MRQPAAEGYATSRTSGLGCLVVRSGVKIVVLDDDPTGTQTVRDIPVLTSWSRDDVHWALTRGTVGCFVSTNTRAMSPVQARAVTAEIVRESLEVAASLGVAVTFMSRGDSTLRGHYPLEPDTIAETAAEVTGYPPDLVLLCPAYPEAGRVTMDGVHYVQEGDSVIPVGETAYARDATFGFTSSALVDWVAEKAGAAGSPPVLSVGLDAVRSTADGSLTALLVSAPAGTTVIVDAVFGSDIDAIATATVQAEAAGRRIIYRCGPSLVRARLGQPKWPALVDDELSALNSRRGTGLVVVGSHVPLTSRQIEAVLELDGTTFVELDVPELLDLPAGLVAERLAATAARAAEALTSRDVVLTTSRTLRRGMDDADSLRVAVIVADALVTTVRDILARTRPSWVVAKGGITSSDMTARTLALGRAWVVGQLLPGKVSVWVGDGAAVDSPLCVIFPGNVGGERSLADVVLALRGRITS